MVVNSKYFRRSYFVLRVVVEKIAIIHMGIHKTGSSSIQMDSRNIVEELAVDGYEMPWVVKQNGNTRGDFGTLPLSEDQTNYIANRANFDACFISRESIERPHVPCDPNLLLAGLQIAERKSNLFLTAETFSSMDEEGVDKLAAYLDPWDEVVIVVYYRRFYSWLASFYNQITKSRKWSEKEKWEADILDFLRHRLERGEAHSGYTAQLLQRLRKRFSNIIVANFHDQSNGGLSESFYCHQLPDTRHACEAVRKKKNPTRSNKRTELDYSDLAYAAFKKGLVKIDSQKKLDQVAAACQQRQEAVLNATASDFPRKCLPPEILKELWNISFERDLFPDML